jgi:putative membrane protein
VSALAGASFLLVVWALVSPVQLPGKAGWPEAVLVLTTAVVTLVWLSRQLPGQNVILAAAVIGCIGGIAHALGAATAIPFGPFIFTDNAGPKILGLVAWPIPAIWIIAILNSRGVARLILRPWRKLRSYGFWLLGVTALLTVLFAVALDPFAAQVKRYWLWLPTKLPFTWHGAPWVSFLGWLVTALLCLAFATPALINKQPHSKKSPPDYHPLAVWLLSLALFAIAAIAHHLWPAAGFCMLMGAVVAFFAIRGARW